MNFNPSVTLQIVANPLAHLPNRSLACLQAFLIGYDSLIGSLRIDAKPVWIPREFNDWVARKYLPRTGQNAFGILSLISKHDLDAFDRFEHELNAFLTESHLLADAPEFVESFTKPTVSSVDYNNLLFCVQRRFNFSLTSKSVTLIRAYVNGVRHAIAMSCPSCEESPDLDDFEKWLSVEFNQTGTFKWERVLLFNTGGDESVAFDQFFEYFKAYMGRNAAASDGA